MATLYTNAGFDFKQSLLSFLSGKSRTSAQNSLIVEVLRKDPICLGIDGLFFSSSFIEQQLARETSSENLNSMYSDFDKGRRVFLRLENWEFMLEGLVGQQIFDIKCSSLEQIPNSQELEALPKNTADLLEDPEFTQVFNTFNKQAFLSERMKKRTSLDEEGVRSANPKTNEKNLKISELGSAFSLNNNFTFANPYDQEPQKYVNMNYRHLQPPQNNNQWQSNLAPGHSLIQDVAPGNTTAGYNFGYLNMQPGLLDTKANYHYLGSQPLAFGTGFSKNPFTGTANFPSANTSIPNFSHQELQSLRPPMNFFQNQLDSSNIPKNDFGIMANNQKSINPVRRRLNDSRIEDEESQKHTRFDQEPPNSQSLQENSLNHTFSNDSDVPKPVYVGIQKKDRSTLLRQLMYSIGNSEIPNKESTDRDSKQKARCDGQNENTEPLTFQELMDGVMRGFVSWSDIKFSQEVVDIAMQKIASQNSDKV
jgi:hypothetical protein